VTFFKLSSRPRAFGFPPEFPICRADHVMFPVIQRKYIIKEGDREIRLQIMSPMSSERNQFPPMTG
jgi:hypothetical protein